MDITNLILIILGAFCVVMLAIGMILNNTAKRKKAKLGYTDVVIKQKKSVVLNAYWLRIYKFFNDVPILNKCLHFIRKQFILLYPTDERLVKQATSKLFVAFAILDLSSLTALVWIETTLFFKIILCVILIIINVEILNIQIHSKEMGLLEEFSQFLDDVRSNYFDTEMIDEAILESIDRVGKYFKSHAERIYDVIIAKEQFEEVQKYNRIAPNDYVKQFVALATVTHNNGSKKTKDGDTFLNNLNELKKETYEEITTRRKIDHKFSCTNITILCPIFLLDVIRKWGVDSMPQLDSFYSGSTGMLVSIALLIVTLACYVAVNRMKNNRIVLNKNHWILEKILQNERIDDLIARYVTRKYTDTVKFEKLLKDVGETLTPRQFTLKRCLYSIGALVCTVVVCLYTHNIGRYNILNSTASFDDLTSGASENDTIALRETVLYYTDYFKNNSVRDDNDQTIISEKPITFFGKPQRVQTKTGNIFTPEGDTQVLTDGTLNTETLIQLIKCDKTIKSNFITENAAKEIISRVCSYQNEYFKWYNLLSGIILAFIAFYVPQVILMYQKKKLQEKMMDEVIRFQAIIILLAPFEGTTVETILEWMEQFADVFGDAITDCLSNYNTNDIVALETLRETEHFEPFIQLVNNLINVDRIGVAKAFSNSQIERTNAQNTRALNNSIALDNRAAAASFIALAPAVAVIVCYLVIPFFIEGMGSMNTANALTSSI